MSELLHVLSATSSTVELNLLGIGSIIYSLFHWKTHWSDGNAQAIHPSSTSNSFYGVHFWFWGNNIIFCVTNHEFSGARVMQY